MSIDPTLSDRLPTCHVCCEREVSIDHGTLCAIDWLVQLISNDEIATALLVARSHNLGRNVVYELIAAERRQRAFSIAVANGLRIH